MNKTFITIITADYFPKALTLYSSLKQFNPQMELQVLVVDNKPVSNSIAAIRIVNANELAHFPMVKELSEKYSHTDHFRWSMKPVFMSYLLERGFEKLIYIDCDMFFFNDYEFLFTLLDGSAILLTPNWINSDPLVDKESFFSLFTSGFFSAGFMGVNKQGIPALNWWAHACHFMMGEHIAHGIRDDQKYLDLFPVKFEGTKIIRHRGCNIGAWNYDECKRHMVNGEVLINERYPVIFIHFDEMLVQGILRGHDKLLKPHLEIYQARFKESGHELSEFLPAINTHIDANAISKLKWKLKLKSRIKKFFYRLSQKL